MLKMSCLNWIIVNMTNVPYQLNANVPKNIMFQSTAVQEFPTSEERQEVYTWVCVYYNIYI